MNKISNVLNKIFTRLQDGQDRESVSSCTSLNLNNPVRDKKKDSTPCMVLTHFTSNLTAPQIEKHYGERVRSRLREMCNWIEYTVNSTDKRK